MTLYWDSSALLRACRMGKAPKGFTRSHALAEFYGTLTGRCLTVVTPRGNEQLKLSPTAALRAVDKTFAHLQWHDLTPAETRQELAAAVKANVLGPNVHDWLHAAAAARSPATQIVTLSAKHFTRLAPKLKLASIPAALAAAAAA